MWLQDKLDAMREDFENGRFPLVPTQDQLDTMRRATRTLIDSRQVDDALRLATRHPRSRSRTRTETV
ncbi:hypothetical protein ABS772_00335 [Methylorubrum podarium]|uniref:Uncharacterized protein n=1 Tax=Methylorubrum podarium TaxID=200476 RepID=A0ABV1QG34_9HYPH